MDRLDKNGLIMRIYLFNDTSIEHAGCRAVMESLDRAFAAHTIVARNRVGERFYDPAAFDACDTIVVNGEGTLHHGASGWLMEMLAEGQARGKRTMLVNALFQQEPPFYPDVLKRLDYFNVREPFSLENARRCGGTPELLLDSCTGASLDGGVAQPGIVGVVKGDTHPHSPEQGLLDAFQFPHFGLQGRWSSVVATLRNCQVYLTGQHHAVYACGLAGTPFVALPGNSHKIEGLLQWSGLPIKVCTTLPEVEEQLHFAAQHPEVFREFQRFLQSMRCFGADDVARVLPESKKAPMSHHTSHTCSRIVFTGDILQTDDRGQPSMALEIHWLANLLRYTVSLACPWLAQEVLAWEANGASRFDGRQFYALNGLDPSVESWAKLVDSPSLSATSCDYMAPFIDNALVVGYGMSNGMLRLLNRMEVPYLDFILHPARFLDDIFFGIRTNVQSIYERLSEFRYPEAMIHLQAGIHRASLLRMQPIDMPPDSGLFAAQSGIDKALVANGRFTYAEDYRTQIEAFLSRHRYVYLKPHPYARDGARLVAFLRALAGDSDRIRVVRDNVYRLMVHPNVSEVCGISSCVLYEADYFGQRATYMSPNRMDFGESNAGFDPSRFVAVYDEFLNPQFWSRILEGVCDTAACPDLQLPRKTNRLRNNLHVYWGYGYLDYEVPLRSMNIHPPAVSDDPVSPGDRHREATHLYECGRFRESADFAADAVVREENAERWNDWAVTQLAVGRKQEARDGFRMALHLDPSDLQAAANLNAISAR